MVIHPTLHPPSCTVGVLVHDLAADNLEKLECFASDTLLTNMVAFVSSTLAPCLSARHAGGEFVEGFLPEVAVRQVVDVLSLFQHLGKADEVVKRIAILPVSECVELLILIEEDQRACRKSLVFSLERS